MSRIVVDSSPWQTAPRALPRGQAVFAIGDVHAHAEHLWMLHERISGIIALEHGDSEVSVVWLGDYIDRGWEPLQTLDLVAAGLGQPGVTEIRLMGNHERYLIDAVTGLDLSLPRMLHWWRYGGEETLKCLAPEAEIENPESVGAALKESLGEGRIRFLQALPLQHRIGDYVFAHAGLNPDRRLDEQEEEDLLWIREPFLSGFDWPHPVTVVHGHTPEGPVALPHRIGIDSGVFASGSLSAVELHGDGLRFLTTRIER
ncbi:serine/threonine protein phosphatase [Pelagibius litoralis]|uniref:Serine/threonine protein phosphatase n=1 Tax=Pelagibius litoralis TaxID=374515 RepID=A0A967C3N1_9PROT|nr:metallophosphoesterase [Pelagibius litoralis]NIA67960.1 serine/threonine protein phosphatase [Pelagibius litoralis]